MDDFSLLGFGDFTSLITKIDINFWGTQVAINCVYDPDVQLPYQFVFSKCRKIEWTLLFPEGANDIEADIIDFQLGKKLHKQPAFFHTDIFDLIILYGSFELKKNW
ncbi:MAG: hypothetical protein SAL07_25380 [Oscillatoria sp. PMC 1051.18]|nr:hypothetical protein [Oscillatoria sp. PMC 1050.18]MEC5033240.1 hypothetical protein [Oscillatoria sp. PMC 1051.18]